MPLMLTTGDVTRLTGFSNVVLHRWTEQGILAPANAGRNRIFNLQEYIACYIGSVYQREEGGGERVRGVVRLVASMSWEDFEHQVFSLGHTVAVPSYLLGNIRRPPIWAAGYLIKPPPGDEIPAGARALMKKLALDKLVREAKQHLDQYLRQRQERKGKRRSRSR